MRGRYVLYDYFQVAGGAERVALEFIEMLDRFELVVSRIFPAARNFEAVDRTCFREIGGRYTKVLGRVLEAIVCFSFPPRFIRNATTVIYSGIFTPLSVFAQQGGLRVYYCHTPPRFLCDLKDVYLKRIPFLLRPFAKLFFEWYFQRYRKALSKMDLIFANSRNVQSRLRDYFDIESEVLYPPVDTDAMEWTGDDGSFVSMARLEPLKRIDRIVQAFMEMPDHRLVVLSGGSQFEKLRELSGAANNIEFVGWTSNAKYQSLVGSCKACLYIPVNEDFGMAPVEALASGKPVIAVASGGCLETITSSVHGVLLSEDPSVAEIKSAVQNYALKESTSQDKAARRSKAVEFSREAFRNRLAQIPGLTGLLRE